MSSALISAWPHALNESSTCWPSRARSSSVTGRPLQAFRTPAMTLSRAKGSTTPERLTTTSCVCSTVVNRRSQDGHCLRRRMLAPSSETRESRTRESVCLQYGQNTACLLPCLLYTSDAADDLLCVDLGG